MTTQTRDAALTRPTFLQDGQRQAFLLLRTVFTVAPILFGLDKFVRVLKPDWEVYLAPWMNGMVGIDAHTFMYVVGAVEIVAGIVVAVLPRIGGYVVALWLLGIIVSLVSVGGYLDIALRDFGLLVGALALSSLAAAQKRPRTRLIGAARHARKRVHGNRSALREVAVVSGESPGHGRFSWVRTTSTSRTATAARCAIASTPTVVG